MTILPISHSPISQEHNSVNADDSQLFFLVKK